MPQRKTQQDGGTRTLHVRIDPVQLDRFRAVVEKEDHRTVSQALRHYMDQRIDDASPQASA